MNTPRTGRLGLGELTTIFGKAGWLFRELPIEDIGIDALVEILDNDIPTGEIIAIQVKSGTSYFAEQNEKSVIYRPDEKHVEYWLKYAIPVIVVLYNPNDKMLIWAPVHKDKVIKTKARYKIEISKKAILNESNYSVLKNVFKLNYQENRMMKLLFDYHWMKMIKDGETVYAEFQDWVNKTLTRTPIKIYCNSKNGHKEFCSPMIFTPGYHLLDVIHKFIPWANFEMDSDGYREHREEFGENFHCIDDDVMHHPKLYDFYNKYEGLLPIKNCIDEMHLYRVVLKLNDLGESFLVIAKYLYDDPKFEFTSFSINDL